MLLTITIMNQKCSLSAKGRLNTPKRCLMELEKLLRLQHRETRLKMRMKIGRVKT